MKIEVRNFRGIQRASIDVAPVALICGPNGAGKTSILRAAAAALASQPIPYIQAAKEPGRYSPLVAKGSAGCLVMGGTDKGGVKVIADDGGTAAVAWPKCDDVVTDGMPPQSSVVASGLIDPMTMPDAARLAMLSDLIGATPTKDDLKHALPSASEKLIEAMWKRIQIDGWDATHKAAEKHGQELKGEWRAATGENYGSAKADGLTPKDPDWDDDLTAFEDATELEIMADNARKRTEEAIAAQAGDAAEIERLEAGAAVPRPDVESLEKNVLKLESDLSAAKEAREALPSAASDEGFPCPHCGAKIAVVGKKYVKAQKVSEAELKKRRLAIAEADGKADNIKSKLGEARSALARAKQECLAIDGDKKRLAEIIAKSKDESGIDPDEARESERRASKRLALYLTWNKAARAHKKIADNQKMLDALAPSGVRRTVLVRALDDFNTESLLPLAQAAKWKPVTLTEDMDLEYGGRGYFLLSASEQYRAKAVLQIAAALKDGSACAILDGADILDQDGRNGLFQLLKKAAIPCLVAMTLPDRSKAPDLAKAGRGQTYWIENAVAVPLVDTGKAAA